MRFDNRTHAGRLLGARLAGMAFNMPVVYALPRGGVPVAVEVAKALIAPLDLLLVRKVGVPWQKELAAASVIDGEEPDIVFNDDVMRSAGLTREMILEVAGPEYQEIERRRALYLPGRDPVKAEGRDAVLVDDGIATGASLKAAIISVRRRKPSRIIVAAPVAAAETAEALREQADEVICLSTPAEFHAVGSYYEDFHQLSDQEVVDHLMQAQSHGDSKETPVSS